MSKRAKPLSSLFAALCCALIAGTAAAAEKSPPFSATILSDGVLSGGFSQSLAIQQTLHKAVNADIQIRPVTESPDRIKALMAGEGDFCICDVDAYYAQEGLLAYETQDTGPTGIRLVLSSSSNFSIGLGLAEDQNILKIADLKNQPVPWIRKSPQLNAYMTAFLAYGGLSWQDVQQMTYPDFDQARIGFEKAQLAAFIIPLASDPASTTLRPRRPFKLAPIDPNRAAAWTRLKGSTPYLLASKTHPGVGLTNPYPLLISSADMSREKVYQLTKLVSENLEDLSAHIPGGENWHATWQNFTWILPYHEGAIDYFKELGIWTTAAQIHQEFLVDRQRRLMRSFAAFSKKETPKQNFAYEWRLYRQQTLSKPRE